MRKLFILFLLLSSEAYAIAGFKQCCTPFKSASATSGSCTFTAGANHLLLGIIPTLNTPAGKTVSDTFGLTWTAGPQILIFNASSNALLTYYANTGVNSGSDTFTYSQSATSALEVAICEWDLGGTPTIDTSGQSPDNSTGTGLHSVSLTTSNASDLLIGIIEEFCNHTVGSGFIEQADLTFSAHWGLFVEDKAVVTSGSNPVSYTESNAGCFDSNPYALIGLAFNFTPTPLNVPRLRGFVD